jgi:hypothetical protein
MRILVLLLAGLLLSGCNLVTSDAPLFGPADLATGPSLKPGLWRWQDCRKSPRADAALDCEGGEFVGPDGRLRYDDKTFVEVAGGDPMILQVPQADEDGVLTVHYAGARARAWDDQGRLTALQIWLVECGPPPPRRDSEKTGSWVTHRPTAGLEIRADNCVARTADAVRRAANETFRRVRREAQVIEWYADAPSAPPAPEPADHRH